jgi:hypothetical protein
VVGREERRSVLLLLLGSLKSGIPPRRRVARVS